MTSDPAAEEIFSIEGIMVAGHPGQVRLLVDQLVLDLEEDDVVSASELPAPPGLIEDLAQPVRLVLRRGARLLGAGSARTYEDVVWRRGELFSMRTRREEPSWRMSEGFREHERGFFAAYGIDIDEEQEETES
jgi:hypothetical protein